MIIAIIPAKGNSKRLKNKNLRILKKKNLSNTLLIMQKNLI